MLNILIPMTEDPGGGAWSGGLAPGVLYCDVSLQQIYASQSFFNYLLIFGVSLQKVTCMKSAENSVPLASFAA